MVYVHLPSSAGNSEKKNILKNINKVLYHIKDKV